MFEQGEKLQVPSLKWTHPYEQLLADDGNPLWYTETGSTLVCHCGLTVVFLPLCLVAIALQKILVEY